MPMQIRRTDGNGPPTNLAEGQLSVEMDTTPPRLWVGVPASLDASLRRLVNPGGVMVSDTVPLAPMPGDLWFNSLDLTLYVYYDDGSGVPSTQFVPVINQGLPDMSGFMPKSGGTMTGPLTLAANANQPLQPVALQQLSTVLADYVQRSELGPPTHVGPAAPAPPNNPGDLWLNTNDNQLYAWDGSNWVPATPPTSGFLPLTGGQMSGSLATPYVATPQMSLLAQPPLNAGVITGTRVGSGFRWQLLMPDSSGETGANAGSNFRLIRYQDNGTLLGDALAIDRQTGQVTLPGRLFVSSDAVIASGIRYSSVTNPAISISGFDGNNLFTITQVGTGSYTIPINYATYDPANYLHIQSWGVQNARTYALANIAGGGAGWSTTPSDRRLKENIQPATDALDVLRAIAVHELDYTPGHEHWRYSFIADEVAALLPYAMVPPQGEDGAAFLHPLHLISVLWRAVQQLGEQVSALQGRT